MAQNKMLIEIEADAVQLTTIKDGMRQTKTTNLRSIQEVLTKDKSIETPFLPGGYGTKKYLRHGDQELVVLATPPHIRKVRYAYHEEGLRETREYKVPLPGFLWIFQFVVRAGDKRTYNEGMAYALKNPVYTPNEMLYQFPFSNVSTGMCWGTIGRPDIGTDASLTSLPDRFLDMEFNNHLDNGNYRSFTGMVDGKEITMQKCSHFFRFLHDQQMEAEKEGRDATFRYDALKQVRSFKEEVDNKIRNMVRR